VLDVGGSFFSYFCFGGIHPSVYEECAEYLNFLVPHLHVVLVRQFSRARAQADYTSSSRGRDMPADSYQCEAACVQYGLTQRERQILAWISIGKTNWEISRIIDVSENTVKNHVQSIYKKLGVKNRTQAAKAVSFIPEIAMSPHFDRSDHLQPFPWPNRLSQGLTQRPIPSSTHGPAKGALVTTRVSTEALET
jgi:DNA-binding CsgD family transcriptional regulator